MDGVYWDSWLLFTAAADQDWSRVRQWFTESGLPWHTYLHAALGPATETVLLHRAIAFGCILGSSLLVYAIGIRSRMCNRAQAALIAIFSALFPAFLVAFELNLLAYELALFLFLLAVLVALESENPRHERRWLWRLAALLFFLCAFTTKSLLAFYLGFLVLFLYHVHPPGHAPPLARGRFILAHLDFVVLPFAFWSLTNALFPTFGFYTDYNQIQFSAGTVSVQFAQFLLYSIIQPFLRIPTAPLIAAAGIVAALAVQFFFARFAVQFSAVSAQPISERAFLGYGLFLLLLAMLPYALVGKSPDAGAFSTRHALLVSLPAAIILVALARILWHSNRQLIQRLVMGGLAFLVITLGLQYVPNYLDWQVRWLHDRSVMLHLADFPTPAEVSTFWIRDQFPRAGNEDYRYYEWASLFKTVWHNEAHLGLNAKGAALPTPSRNRIRRGFNLMTFDPRGCIARLEIQPGSAALDRFAALEYIRLARVRPQDTIPFLETFTHLSITTPAAEIARGCAPIQWQSQP